MLIPTESVTVTTPPVVSTTSKVTLADHLDLRNMPLATTPAGKNFAIKALHPADHEIKSVRAPGSVVPTVGMTTDMLDTIDIPEGCTYANIIQTSNIVVPATIEFYNDSHTLLRVATFFNSGLGGPGVQTYNGSGAWPVSALTFVNHMYEKFERYRVLAQSVTCDLVAPALNDQGTIVAAQYVQSKRTTNPSIPTPFPVNSAGTQATIAVPPTHIYHAVDNWLYGERPQMAALMMGTSAYSAKAREGAYQPLKISTYKWRDMGDPYLPFDGSLGDMNHAFTPTYYRLGNYPIWNGQLSWTLTLPGLPKPQSDMIGIIRFSGFSTNGTAIRLRLRQCLEITPRIGGIYANLAESPYPPDAHAFAMINEIFGRMKDAYPSSYNSTGKLKEIIGKIGNAVVKYVDPALSMLSAIPGVGSYVAPVKAVISTGKAIANALNPGSKQEVPAPMLPPRQSVSKVAKKAKKAVKVASKPKVKVVRR